MRLRLWPVLLLCVFLAAPAIIPAMGEGSVSAMMFDDDPGKFYNYCPSYIQTSPDERVIFYCKNRDAGRIVDSIYTRKAILDDGVWVWGEQSAALRHSDSGWDSIHVCDPDVKKGRFLMDGHEYSWVMFFLATDQSNNNHNQIGVAFADSIGGPWEKWAGNPLVISSSLENWGVGQPSAVSLDKAGKFLLFYSGVDSTTTLAVREIDLSDMGTPQIGPAVNVASRGLTEADGGGTNFFHNVGVALDEKTGNLYAVRERGPAPMENPTFISGQLQVLYAPVQDILAGKGIWTVDGNVTPTESGRPRNHNAAILTDPYGLLVGGPEGYELAYSAADTGLNHLWSYRLYDIKRENLSRDDD